MSNLLTKIRVEIQVFLSPKILNILSHKSLKNTFLIRINLFEYDFLPTFFLKHRLKFFTWCCSHSGLQCSLPATDHYHSSPTVSILACSALSLLIGDWLQNDSCKEYSKVERIFKPSSHPWTGLASDSSPSTSPHCQLVSTGSGTASILKGWLFEPQAIILRRNLYVDFGF